MGAAGFSDIASGNGMAGAAAVLAAAAAGMAFLVMAAGMPFPMVRVTVNAGGHQLAVQIGRSRLVGVSLGSGA